MRQNHLLRPVYAAVFCMIIGCHKPAPSEPPTPGPTPQPDAPVLPVSGEANEHSLEILLAKPNRFKGLWRQGAHQRQAMRVSLYLFYGSCYNTTPLRALAMCPPGRRVTWVVRVASGRERILVSATSCGCSAAWRSCAYNSSLPRRSGSDHERIQVGVRAAVPVAIGQGYAGVDTVEHDASELVRGPKRLRRVRLRCRRGLTG